MIDLRKEVKKLLDNYGHYVLLQRTSRKIRCRCWSEINQEAKADCTSCIGAGWISVIERHRVRNDPAIQPITRPNLSNITTSGRSWVDALNVFFRHDAHPNIDDYIYHVGWDKDNENKPTHLIRTYKINDVYQERGMNGRIEYYVVSARAETIRTQHRKIFIRTLNGISNYEFE